MYDCLNNEVKEQLEIRKRRESLLEIEKLREQYNQNVAKTEEDETEIKEQNTYYKKNYTGNVKVNSYAPLYQEPDMFFSREIYRVPDNKVSIIERVKNGKYYKVKSNGIEGYIWTAFIID